MIKIRIMVTSRTGVLSEVELEGTAMIKNMNEHDLSAVLFAVEFAINNKASEIIGKSVRAHITEV